MQFTSAHVATKVVVMVDFYYRGHDRATALARLQSASLLAIDCETVSLNDLTMVGVGIYISPTEGFYFPAYPNYSEHIPMVMGLIADPTRTKIMHNGANFDLPVLDQLAKEDGYESPDDVHYEDTSIWGQCAGLPGALQRIGTEWLGARDLFSITDLFEENSCKTMLGVPEARTAEKCLNDCRTTYALYEYLGRTTSPAQRDCYNVDRQLVSVLRVMQAKGLGLRQGLVAEHASRLQRECDRLRSECDSEGLGNPGSPQQVGHALASRGNILPIRKGKIVTDEEALESCPDPLAAAVLAYRRSSKLLCLSPDTKILKGNLTWEEIQHLRVGDKLVGIDENTQGVTSKGGTNHRRFRESRVEYLSTCIGEAFEIETDKGTVICSAEHRWLVYPKHPNDTQVGIAREWIATKDIQLGMAIAFLSEPIEQLESFEAGYISAAFDGEGCLTNGIKPQLIFTQNDGKMLDKVCDILERHEFSFNVVPHGMGKTYNLYITGGLGELIRFFAMFNPVRLRRDFWVSRSRGAVPARVAKIVSIGSRTLFNLQTSTETFIAGGFVSHNSTYIQPWLGKARAHTHFRLDLSTGRLASGSLNGWDSVNRNLQNIPPAMREVFAPDNGVWTWADFSQIELRVLAHLSQDTAMQDAYRNGWDMHQRMADEGKSTRAMGKLFNFAMVFGASNNMLVKQTGMALTDVQRMRAAWRGLFSGASKWMDEQQFGHNGEWTEDGFGRRMRLPDLATYIETQTAKGLQPNVKAFGAHVGKCAVNYPVQGTAASIMKRGILMLAKQGYDMRATVHDEILLDGDYDLPEEFGHIHPELATPYETKKGLVWS